MCRHIYWGVFSHPGIEDDPCIIVVLSGENILQRLLRVVPHIIPQPPIHSAISHPNLASLIQAKTNPVLGSWLQNLMVRRNVTSNESFIADCKHFNVVQSDDAKGYINIYCKKYTYL